uniref:BTB domain-containing protein n=1 Tax=Lepeophtheirus salmonis TaxID=72036 RepID=A0A0K2VF20_LEPSM
MSMNPVSSKVFSDLCLNEELLDVSLFSGSNIIKVTLRACSHVFHAIIGSKHIP